MLLYKSLYFCYLSKEAGLIVDTFVLARTNSNPNINFKLLYMPLINNVGLVPIS